MTSSIPTSAGYQPTPTGYEPLTLPTLSLSLGSIRPPTQGVYQEPSILRRESSTSDQAEARGAHLLPSHAQRVSEALSTLKDEIEECRLSRRYSGPAKFIIDQVWLQLKAEYLQVEQIVANLTDEYRALGQVDWSKEEPTISKRCGPHYGRYAQKLEDTFECLKTIASCLGLVAHHVSCTILVKKMIDVR
jgi:hypothetical protein